MFSKYFNSLSEVKRITLLALFLALSIVANTILDIDITPQNKITFTYFIMFISAYVLGALPTFLIGFAGDGLGYLIMPDGAYWLYGLSLGLMGFIIGIILHYLPIKSAYIKTAISCVVCYILFTICLNSLINYFYVYTFIWGGQPNKSIWLYLAGYLPPRLLIQTIVYMANYILCFLTIPIINRFIGGMAESG